MTTQSWGERAAEDLFQAVQGYVERGLKSVCERGDGKLAALEARIAALESRPAVKHCGVWRENETYAEGNLATFQGGLWLARRATAQRPNASGDWQLIVKKGHA